jgi:hypothetical protein
VLQGSPLPTRTSASSTAASMAAHRKAPSAILIPDDSKTPAAAATRGTVPDTPLSSWDTPTPTPAKAGAGGASPSEGSDWDAESPALPSLGASAKRGAGQEAAARGPAAKGGGATAAAAAGGDESSDWDESPAASKRTSKERRRHDSAELADSDARKDDELLRVRP